MYTQVRHCPIAGVQRANRRALVWGDTQVPSRHVGVPGEDATLA